MTVDGGPVLKRSLPRAQGRATVILKRMSHINLVLSESETAKAERLVIAKPEKKKKKDTKKPAKAKVKEDKEDKPEKDDKKTQKSAGLRKFFRRKSV